MSDDRAEAERLLKIAEKFLQTRDLSSSHDFAVLAQETAPLLDGSDQILAISDVLLAGDTKKINNRPNWYSILHVDSGSDNLESIKKQYRRLALLLHPDKNKYPFAHDAFQLVADAWAVLSDQTKKKMFDDDYNVFSKVNLSVVRKQNQEKVRLSSFWTACPYCYNLYEYPRVYKDCCLICDNCNRSMYAKEISTLPPVVEGQEAYYCCWGFFPMGFSGKNDEGGSRSGMKDSGIPNWVPPVFGNNMNGKGADGNGGDEEFVNNLGGNQNQSGNVTPVHRNVNVSGNVTPIHRNVNGNVTIFHRNVDVIGNVTPVHRNVNLTSVPTPGTKKRGRAKKTL